MGRYEWKGREETGWGAVILAVVVGIGAVCGQLDFAAEVCVALTGASATLARPVGAWLRNRFGPIA